MEATIDLNTIPGESSLVDQELKDQLAGIFGRMEKKATIRAMADLPRGEDREMASFLRAIVSVGPNLELELYGPGEADQVSELDTAWLPVTGLYKGGAYGRAAFHEAPGGKEINSFALAVYDLAGPGQEVPKGTRKKIGRLDKKANIKVRASLAYHHYPLVMTACQQIAILDPDIETGTIDAALYDDLVTQYDTKRIPTMIINNSRIVMGGRTMDKIVTLLKQ